MEDPDPQDDLCEQPLVVGVFERAVILTGPDGVHLSMTANAALASARLLEDAAEKAAGFKPDAG